MNIELNQRNKQTVWRLWRALDEPSAGRAVESARRLIEDDVRWHGPEPIGELRGVDVFLDGFWSPLRRAFPDLRRQTHVFFGGRSSGRIDGLNDGHMWVGGTGYLQGTFDQDYLRIPATGRGVDIRWGEFCRVEAGRVAEVYFLLDLIDLMQQAGFTVLPPARGRDGLFPPPRAKDGILLDAQDEAQSRYSLEHIRRFIFDGLNRYDQRDLDSMRLADFFHPEVHWYGPGGIGACFGFDDFQQRHQQHWLRAFPDRRVQDLDALIAEGNYSGGPGWAGVKATHTGEYLDCAATANPVEFNGLDFWKRDGDRYIENWVFVDMIHLFRQLGVDLFARLA